MLPVISGNVLAAGIARLHPDTPRESELVPEMTSPGRGDCAKIFDRDPIRSAARGFVLLSARLNSCPETETWDLLEVGNSTWSISLREIAGRNYRCHRIDRGRASRHRAPSYFATSIMDLIK